MQVTASYDYIEHDTTPAIGPLFEKKGSMFCDNEGRPIGTIEEIFKLSNSQVVYLVKNDEGIETLYTLEHGRVKVFDPEEF